MNYDEYKYLWPPRPETKIPQGSIKFYTKLGYAAQVKKNGTCTVIFARGNEVIFKTRHNDDHRAWQPKTEHVKFFANRSNKWNVFVAELLHSKTPHIKDQLYLFDIIVHEGQQLVGKTFDERQTLLHSLWEGTEERDQIRVSPNVAIARTFYEGFDALWAGLQAEDEGLVFKRRAAKLEACMKQTSNSGWQAKCRRPHSNYTF